jgi:hypothetical protein
MENFNVVTWHEGVNDYLKNTLYIDPVTKQHKFEHEILDVDTDPNLTLDDIYLSYLSQRQTKVVEVLFSGGMDSELIIRFCLKHKIPVRALTMRVMTYGYPSNLTDLYYSERFCRMYGVEQKIVDMDVVPFMESGKFLDYLRPYNITRAHVATQFWLMEQASGFAVMGGDYRWPWTTEKVISPINVDYSCYQRFFTDRGIHGIGNMIAHSLDGLLFFTKKHIETWDDSVHKGDYKYMPHFKSQMFNNLGFGDFELRMKSYGFEGIMRDIMNDRTYDKVCKDEFGEVTPTIKWNNKLASVLGGEPGFNDRYTPFAKVATYFN